MTSSTLPFGRNGSLLQAGRRDCHAATLESTAAMMVSSKVPVVANVFMTRRIISTSYSPYTINRTRPSIYYRKYSISARSSILTKSNHSSNVAHVHHRRIDDLDIIEFSSVIILPCGRVWNLLRSVLVHCRTVSTFLCSLTPDS